MLGIKDIFQKMEYRRERGRGKGEGKSGTGMGEMEGERGWRTEGWKGREKEEE